MAEVVGDKRPELSLRRSDRASEKPPERRSRSRGALPMQSGRTLRMLERREHRAGQIGVCSAPSSLFRQHLGREGQALVQRRRSMWLGAAGTNAACWFGSPKRLLLEAR